MTQSRSKKKEVQAKWTEDYMYYSAARPRLDRLDIIFVCCRFGEKLRVF